MATTARICSAENCKTRYYALGFCNKHYLRVRRYGDPAFVKQLKGGQPAVERPARNDVILAAGWYEGEGSTNGTQVSITQKDPWMLARLLALFGGAVYPKCGSYTRSRCKVWTVGGSRARGFAMTIYGFLSPRRQEQLRRVLQ